MSNLEKFQVSSLPTRMLMSRLKNKFLFDSSEATKQKAIVEAYEFFVKNQSMVQDDIRLIFG